MNKLLLHSSIISGIIHFYILYIYRPPILFTFNILTGIFTSIINHSSYNTWCMWLDRIYMIIGFSIDTYYIFVFSRELIILFKIILLTCVYDYMIAKVVKNNYVSDMSHIKSHVMLTIIHYLLCQELCKKDE